MEYLSPIEVSEMIGGVVRPHVDCGWLHLADAVEAYWARGEPSPLVDELEEKKPGALDEPHLLGWIHQWLGEEGRKRAFTEHTRDEAKHVDSVVATQLYTPRWVADLLVEELLRESGPDATVCDPACGGGQFLLAAFDALVRRGAGPRRALELLHGRDLDPSAVDATRRGLAWHASRAGLDLEEARTLATERVWVADGLDLEADAWDFVVTNPPYMGSRSMPRDLKARLSEDYRPFHADLANAFVEQARRSARRGIAILSQQNLWYLSRFEKGRRSLLRDGNLDLFAHFGPGLFGALDGEKASVVGWVWRRRSNATFRCWDLRDLPDAPTMRRALQDEEPRELSIDRFDRLPGAPVAHWVPDPLFLHFSDDTPTVGELFDVPGSQNKTGRNREFVRSADAIEASDLAPLDAEHSRSERWRYYSKGGPYAPWWGNWEWAVDWSEDARAFYASNPTSNLLREEWVDRAGLCYTDFGGRTFNARWKPPTALFDMAGPAIFHPDDDESALLRLLTYLNSEPARLLLNALNPTLHYQVRDVRNLPLPHWEEEAELEQWAREAVSVARLLNEKEGSGERLIELEERTNDEICRRFGATPGGPLPKHHLIR